MISEIPLILHLPFSDVTQMLSYQYSFDVSEIEGLFQVMVLQRISQVTQSVAASS